MKAKLIMNPHPMTLRPSDTVATAGRHDSLAKAIDNLPEWLAPGRLVSRTWRGRSVSLAVDRFPIADRWVSRNNRRR